jgi:stage V sporulation protein B
VPLKVVLRVGLATLVATLLGRLFWGAPKLLVPALAIGVVAVYAVVLLVTRELGRDDLALVKRVLKRSA